MEVKCPDSCIADILREANLTCSGICAGKNSVADYLVDNHDFSRLYLSQEVSPLGNPYMNELNGVAAFRERSFTNVDALLEFVTKHWKQRWITTDIWNEQVLENLLRRPFFILVSVDAPVSLRWQRFRER